MVGQSPRYLRPDVSFAALIQKLGHPPSSKRRDVREKEVQYTAAEIFGAWIRHQRRPFVPGTAKKLFRLLFPHEGSRRRYDIKETRLAAQLEQVLGISGLTRWDAIALNGTGGTGCLGEEVRREMARRRVSAKIYRSAYRQPNATSAMTISEVDALLDQLAAWSSWSQFSQAPLDRPSPMTILRRLYRDSRMSPHALSVLTQVILRDLRPLTCPLPRLSVNRFDSLIMETITSAPEQLVLEKAMHTWDPLMAKIYREGKGNIDWCATAAEEARAREELSDTDIAPGPILGINVKVSLLSRRLMLTIRSPKLEGQDRGQTSL